MCDRDISNQFVSYPHLDYKYLKNKNLRAVERVKFIKN